MAITDLRDGFELLQARLAQLYATVPDLVTTHAADPARAAIMAPILAQNALLFLTRSASMLGLLLVQHEDMERVLQSLTTVSGPVIADLRARQAQRARLIEQHVGLVREATQAYEAMAFDVLGLDDET